MGYETYYELEYSTYPGRHSVSEEVETQIQEYVDSNEEMQYSLGYTSKWYEHDDDMLELSEEFPDVLFRLFGMGEESGDLWYTYYLNGKMQHTQAKITYDTFNPELLR